MYIKISFLPSFSTLYYGLLSITLLISTPTLHTAPAGVPPQMSQADIDAMMKMMEDPEMIKLMQDIEQDLMKMSPEELAQLEQQARLELESLGINPDTFEPLDPNALSQPALQQEQPATVVKQEETKMVETGAFMEDEVARILRKLIFFLNNIRNKSASMSGLYPEYKKFDSWKEALDDLVFYIALLNKPEHHKQLTAKEYEKLMRVLKKLYTTLEKYEPQLEHTEEVTDDEYLDDPYEILGLPYTASQEAIEAVYEQYIKEKDPKKLEAKLTAEGVSEKDIKRQVRAAQLTFSTVTEAYEKLSEPNIRAQTDRTLKGKIAHAQQALVKRTAAIDAIIKTLSDVVYQEQLLTLCEQFIKNYEPQELAKKQELEKAEQKAQKDLEARQKLQATKTTVGKLDQTYSPASNYPSAYPSSGSYGNYPYDNYGGYTSPSSYGDYGTQSSNEPKSKKSGGGSGGSGAKGEKADDKKSSDKKDDKKTEKKEAPQHPFEKALASFNKELVKLEQAYAKPTIKAALTVFQNPQAPTETVETALTTLHEELNPFLKTLAKDADKIRTEMNNVTNFKISKFVGPWQQTFNRYKDIVTPLTTALTNAQAPTEQPRVRAQRRDDADQPAEAAEPVISERTTRIKTAATPLKKQLDDFADLMKNMQETVNPPVPGA